MVESDTVLDIKRALFDETGVQPHRQKLIGLVKGKLPENDSVLLKDMNLLSGKTFMMMGSPEEDILVAPEVLPDVSFK